MMLRPPTLQAAPRAVLSAADGAPAQGVRDALATATSASKGYRDRLESVTTTIHQQKDCGTNRGRICDSYKEDCRKNADWQGYRKTAGREDYYSV